MQTFVPHPDFQESARVLDRQRLGKQRVEVLQLLKAISGESRGWTNHPAAHMWSSNVEALVAYGVAICEEWIARGYKDTCKEKILAYSNGNSVQMPDWWGNKSVHASHRSNLLRKNPAFYGQYGWTESPEEPYVWP
jgi:hypothetical protein